MHKKLLKKFAITARQLLSVGIKSRLAELQKAQNPLIAAQLRFQTPGHLIETATYTWFNRLVALRYLELNGRQLPGHLSPLPAHLNLLKPANLDDLNALLRALPESDFAHTEILGWLYQYYHHAEKSRLIKKRRPYASSEIPTVTQLFTPEWAVKYLVDGTLGQKTVQDPKYLTFLDPCCGSGHILVYAFELFYQLYQAAGYPKSDIPVLILEHNLYGLDLDPRAAQLARLALLFKASTYDSSIFDKPIAQHLHIHSIPGSVRLGKSALAELPTDLRPLGQELFDEFTLGHEVGSLLLPGSQDFSKLANYFSARPTPSDPSAQPAPNSVSAQPTSNHPIQPLLEVHHLLTQTYDFVVTNPPYLDSRLMNPILKSYLSDHFSDYKRDLFAAFIYRSTLWLKPSAQLGFMTPRTWLFTKSYTKLRSFILKNLQIISLFQPEPQSFFSEAAVEVCTFILQNAPPTNPPASTSSAKSCPQPPAEFTHLHAGETQTFRHYNSDFENLPDAAFLFWLSPHQTELFRTQPTLAEFAAPHQGIITGDNDRFIRYWWEVAPDYLAQKTTSQNTTAPKAHPPKWFPYNKGGDYRKWYGNRLHVINWADDGYEIRNFTKPAAQNADQNSPQNPSKPTRRSRVQNLDHQFQPALSWSALTSGEFSARLYDETFTFGSAGLCCFPTDHDRLYLLGLLNSKVITTLIRSLNPTLNFNVGDLAKLPVIMLDACKTTDKATSLKAEVEQLVKQNLALARQDWDASELSWDFTCHPIIQLALVGGIPVSLDALFSEYTYQQTTRRDQLRQNEQRLNQIFIDLYGLGAELTPDVPDDLLSLKVDTPEQLTKSLLSYFVGLTLGRYQLPDYRPVLPAPNLLPLGQPQTSLAQLSQPGDPLADQLAALFSHIFGHETLSENLAFLARHLDPSPREVPLDTIRRYLATKFFADHCRLYRGRPIYWLLDSTRAVTTSPASLPASSPRQKSAFSALTYQNHYQKSQPQLWHDQALLPVIHQAADQIAELQSQINREPAAANRAHLSRQLNSLEATFTNLRAYEAQLQALAENPPTLDLDLSSPQNHARLAPILAPIPVRKAML